jgi:hypothetical protein
MERGLSSAAHRSLVRHITGPQLHAEFDRNHCARIQREVPGGPARLTRAPDASHDTPMATLHIEEIDLADLSRLIVNNLGASSTEGFIVGRTLIRDAVFSVLECSELEAEQLVDTLISRGFVRFEADDAGAGGHGLWHVVPPAA